MREYIYYWFHHMMPENERKYIEKIIDKKDYNAFINLYKEYTIKGINQGGFYEEFNCWCPIVYLPNSIAVYENGEWVKDVSALDKSEFEKIVYSECECG